MKRRLAAILAADIVGYSRLVGLDEDGTLTALRSLKQEIIEPTVAAHDGRVVKYLGDGFLAKFVSVSEAFSAGLKIQKMVAESNLARPEERRIRHRIGLNYGDVVIEDGDVYGETVNVAARLEGLAEPEGIAVSGKVYNEINGKHDVGFLELGLQDLKNIKEPIVVYRAVLPGNDVPPDRSAAGEEGKSIETTEPKPSDINDVKPSIAVLPFQNMSNDVDQEYFADGVTEDIITTLSHVRWLFVVARNSTFAYKEQSPDIREVGRDLGVRYVLEGSVRKAGDRVRVTAQLIDAGTGNHVWADRYDRQLVDIFDLQDEMAETISARIEPEVGYAERDRARKRATQDLGAWDLYQRGMWHLYRFTKEDAGSACIAFEKAIVADPNFSAAYTGLAYLQLYDVMNGYSSNFEHSLRDAEANVRRALALDQRDVLARFTLGRLHTLKMNYDEAIKEFERGVELNPGFAQIYHGIGFAHAYGGNPEDAIPFFEKAIRLSPQDPHLTSFMAVRSYAYLTMREYDKAVESAEGAISQPNAMVWPHIFRTSALGHQASPRTEAAVRDLLNYSPDLTCGEVRRQLYYTRKPEDLEHCISGLTKAGLAK
jgi:adenylate cyclase